MLSPGDIWRMKLTLLLGNIAVSALSRGTPISGKKSATACLRVIGYSCRLDTCWAETRELRWMRCNLRF